MTDENTAKSQAEKFREAALAIEADDDEARFKGRLLRVAKSPPRAKGDDKSGK